MEPAPVVVAGLDVAQEVPGSDGSPGEVDLQLHLAEGGLEEDVNAPRVAGRRGRPAARRVSDAGRIGGAVYDALVALTAKTAGATLITADRRALPTYGLVGVALRTLD